MMISTTYASATIAILAQVLPMLGIEVGSAELTTTLQTLITIGAGLWIMKERLKRGDLNVFGVRK